MQGFIDLREDIAVTISSMEVTTDSMQFVAEMTQQLLDDDKHMSGGIMVNGIIMILYSSP